MVNTFDALAKFGGDGEPNVDSTPDNSDIAKVDISAVINRLNDLETAVNEIRKQQTDPKPEPQTDPKPEPQTDPKPEPQSGE